MSRKIYLASSWRNTHQPAVLHVLRTMGHEVYDFRNPSEEGPGGAPDAGFSWRQTDPGWPDVPQEQVLSRYRQMLAHPTAQKGFTADFDAMHWADTCVLVMPCGRSAHLEFGWMAAAGKRCVVYFPTLDGFEPELMYLVASLNPQGVLAFNLDELSELLEGRS